MKTPAQRIGGRGEGLAARFLMEKGYEIVEHNYRYGQAEIDLIVRQKQLLVFVEVKTRRNADYGYPEEFVSARQRAQIIRAADHYIRQHDWQGNIRFDIIAILTEPALSIEHLTDAFY